MADFDLRKLSAPLEKLRPEVEAAYKRIDKKWAAITETLKKLPIPGDVKYLFSENEYNPPEGYRLDWRKWNGKKRLCIVYQYLEHTPDGEDFAESVTPFEEWSAEERIQMMEHVPELFRAAQVKTEEFIASTKDKEDE